MEPSVLLFLWDLFFESWVLLKNQGVLFGFSKDFDMTKQNHTVIWAFFFTDSGKNRLY